VYLICLSRAFMECTKTSFVNFTPAEENLTAILKRPSVLVLQFCLLSRHGSRYEIHIPTRGWTAPTARSERREYGSSLQSVPRNWRWSAESDCCAQRKVRSLTIRNVEWFLYVCFSKKKKIRVQKPALFQYHLVYSWGTCWCTCKSLYRLYTSYGS
jgi:hypothetical protein